MKEVRKLDLGNEGNNRDKMKRGCSAEVHVCLIEITQILSF